MAGRDGISISLDGEDQLLDELERLPDAKREQVSEVLDGEAQNIRSEALRRAPVSQNRLRSSIHVEKITDITRSISTDVAYAPFVAFGTRPHFPPVEAVTGQLEALDEWVKLEFGVSGKERERAAFLVARKIAQRGTPEQPFMRPAFDARKDKLVKKLKDIVNADTGETPMLDS